MKSSGWSISLELQKIESEKTKAELQQQTTELEMQALRAQMNPHFIFNSLNSINRFILQNNRAQASEVSYKIFKACTHDIAEFTILLNYLWKVNWKP